MPALRNLRVGGGPYCGLASTYGTLNLDYAKGAASDLNITRGRQNSTRKVMLGVKVDF